MSTKDDCPRHLCGTCGKFVPRVTVSHGGGYPDYDYWAAGVCGSCGSVDVQCVPISKPSPEVSGHTLSEG